MASYKKTVIVWDKASFLSIPASALDDIEAKKTEMIGGGVMHEQQGYTETDTTVTNLTRFTTQAAADEWASFIDNIATTNNLTKISTRIVSVDQAD